MLKLGADPQHIICSFMDPQSRHSVSQACKGLKDVPFSKEAYSNKEFFRLQRILSSAGTTLWKKVEEGHYSTHHRLTSVGKNGLVIRNRNNHDLRCISTDTGKEIYSTEFVWNKKYIFSNEQYFFYAPSSTSPTELTLIEKTTGKSKTLQLPIHGHNGYDYFKDIYHLSNNKAVFVISEFRNEKTMIYDFATNTIQHTNTYPESRSFKINRYLYLIPLFIQSHAPVILDTEDQLKQVTCDTSEFQKYHAQYVNFFSNGERVVEYYQDAYRSSYGFVFCRNDQAGNIIKEWEKVIDFRTNDPPVIKMNSQFVVIAQFDTRTDDERIHVLDVENGTTLWEKRFKVVTFNLSSHSCYADFFQSNVLFHFEKKGKNDKTVIKFIHFDPKTKKSQNLPSITLQKTKHPEIKITDNAIFVATNTLTGRLFHPYEAELRVVKYEYDPKQVKPAVRARKINKLQKFCRFLRNIVWKIQALAKKIFCCKK